MSVELMTFQDNYTRLWLANQRIYRAGWRRGGEANPWNHAYRWMSREMSRRGLQTYGHAPVWAWPMSPLLGGPPTFTTADALLGEPEFRAGTWVMELCVPDHMCLRSCYRWWNGVIDDFLVGHTSGGRRYQLYDPPLYRVASPMQPDDLQFCLPFIDRRWVRTMRPLPQRPMLDDWDAAV